MKRIEAIVRASKVDDIKEVLGSLGASGMTVSEVRGFGRQQGHSQTYRGAEYRVELIPKAQIEVIVADEQVAEIVTALTAAARTGSIGDGKIFVTPVDDVIRIRTGETGPQAL